MSNQHDRPFIPFNFSTVVPFDTFAVALNELPTPQLAEPEGEFTSFAQNELPTVQPSPAMQADMLKLMAATARDGEWGELETSPPRESSASKEDWSSSFCEQLNASLRHVQKREINTSPMPPTPKRPRHSPSPAPAKSAKMLPVTRGSARSPYEFPEKRRLAVRKGVADEPEEASHKSEMRMRQVLKDVDADEFNDFITYLQRFQRRPQSFSKQTDDPDEAMLLATSSEGAISDLRQKVLLFAKKGAIRYVEPELLSGVIAILEKRIFESSRACSVVQNGDVSKASTHEATIGALSAATVLAILCAPGSPRRLLVEELLDEIASLLKSCATFIIFPSCDPLYKESKPAKRRKKNRKNQRQSGRAEHVPDPNDEGAGDSELEHEMRRSTAPRRTLLKKDEALLNYFCIALDALSALLEREQHLPDSVVSTTASTCLQSLSVTGIPRVQVHTMKAACAIFQSYPHHRLAMLDDVREAASRIPAARRHLRSFKLPEDQTLIRASSALLAQLLCGATVEPLPPTQSDANGNGMSGTDSKWAMLRKECHDHVVKLAMHALDPLLQRAYSDRDVEYRAAFQALLEDILTLYGRPEWPSAELILQTISVSIITRLRSRDEKSVYARNIAVDVLGALAAKMCELYGSDILRESGDTLADGSDAKARESDRERLLVYLDSERSRLFAAAYFFCEARFISDDYSTALNLEASSKGMAEERKRNDEENRDEVLDGQECSNAKQESLHDRVAPKAESRKKRVTERRLRGEEVSRSSAMAAAISVGRRRSFTAGVRTILEAILDGMHDPAPTIRARSIKALSSIDKSCHGIIQVVPEVLKFIEGSCRDVSTLARDAALDLLGRSLLPGRDWSALSDDRAELPEMKQPDGETHSDLALLSNIFSIVEKRLCDTATSVRKRAISILRTALTHALEASERLRREPMNSIESIQEIRKHEAKIIQICASLVTRLDDPETTVREAAERTLRLGLFGFDISQQLRSDSDHDAESASQLATRFVTVFARLPSGIHVSFISRIVHKALLIKHRSLLYLIVNAIVEQMQDCEANMAKVLAGKELRALSKAELDKLRPISVRRVACASVIFAFGGLDDSLVVPHCRSLAPSIKGVHELGTSENDLICVQRMLNLLEIGFKSSEEFDESFLEEVVHDVEFIVCTSPLSMLEEASVKCFCAVSKRIASDDENPLKSAAVTFHSFLMDSMDSLKTYCEGAIPEKPTAVERNARGALVRLGLLMRYGIFDAEFVSEVYRTLETACTTVTVMGERDLLPRAAIRALSHFLIRHRSYLPNGTRVLSKVWSMSTNRTSAKRKTTNEGIYLSILQGFHDLLRDEEERNSKVREEGKASKTESRVSDDTHMKAKNAGTVFDPNDSKDQVPLVSLAKPILAAEEDAEAGFVALSAQSMRPCFRNAANSSFTVVRRMVANILGLLVRQGLLLPATVVTELFTLLLDRDTRCREYAHRVVSFLADRHSGMLASAAVPALRICFQNSFVVSATGREQPGDYQQKNIGSNQHEANRTEAVNDRPLFSSRPVPTVEEIISLTIDERTGQSLLSQALMTMRREQRRGVFESMMREFDARVVLILDSPTENSNDTRLHEEEPDQKVRASNGETEVMTSNRMDSEEDEDDEVSNVACPGMDLSAVDPRCSLPTLYFVAITLASIDYTSGAGVGGSLGQGGGTAAAETKLKYAREDVTELVGLATRIISNSGQAILRLAKQLRKSRSLNVEKKLRVAYYASRMSILLDLKHHLKVERWKPLLSSDEAKEEAEVSSNVCRMPSFTPSGCLLAESTWNPSAIPQATEEGADNQLDLFCKLMREDAIDDADITMPSRKGVRSMKKRNASRKASAVPAPRNSVSVVTPSPRRVVHPRRASAPKKLRYSDDDSEDDGSDFDPTKQ